MYINSSQPVLVAQLSHMTVGGGASMSLLPALAQLADNYTLVAFRRQYDDDQQVTDINTLHYAVVQFHFNSTAVRLLVKGH